MARYKQQGTARDGMGRILDSATITVYLAGTTTLATIYSQESGGSAVSGSQVTAAADGSWSFWVDDGDYATSQKFKYSAAKSGFVTRTWDDLTFFPSVDDHKVAMSAGDATSDYLPNKLAVSAPVTKTVTTVGGAEVVQFGLSVGDYITTSAGSATLKFSSDPGDNDMLRVDTTGKQFEPRTPEQVAATLQSEGLLDKDVYALRTKSHPGTLVSVTDNTLTLDLRNGQEIDWTPTGAATLNAPTIYGSGTAWIRYNYTAAPTLPKATFDGSTWAATGDLLLILMAASGDYELFWKNGS